MRKFARNACGLLTKQQTESLSLSALQVLDATDMCRWSQGEAATFDVSVFANVNPLTLDYADANKPFWVVFEPFNVNGFPAVKRQAGPKPPVYDCNVAIATGPDQGIEIKGLSNGPEIDWCGKAVQAAEFVVRNLGG
jgi:hypothetical protein